MTAEKLANHPFGRLRAAVVVSGLALAALCAMPAHAATPAKLPPGMQAVTEVEGIQEIRLANGLQLLLAPDDSKPTTTVNLTYHVGSRHENYGETGMAHLLEHLIFKGSPKHPAVWAEFSKRGLKANGSTWFDRTNYFASFAANDENLKWYVGWLADSMVHSYIARKDLDSEMTVVRNEMEMGENDPQRILYQRLLSAMFDWHNYAKDTIGARADVENVDIGRLQAFYRLYYQPDNATLIVSGKFDASKVLAWVQQSFGAIPKPKRTLPKLYTLDPSQDGERVINVRRVGGTPLLYAGYHTPPGGHPDTAALDMLELIFGDAPAGRLHKRLVEARLASSVGAENFSFHDPSAALFVAVLGPEHDVDKARDAMLGALESVVREPITAEELERARTKWLKSWEQEFSNPEAVGVSLSEAIALGDWRFFFLQRDRVAKVTLAEVQRVAEQVLLPSNRTLARYEPTAEPKRAPAPTTVDIAAQFKDWKPAAAAAAVAAFDASPANIDAKTQKAQLAGGLKLALLPKPTRGNAVRATLVLRFGDEKSLANQGDVPEMVAAMLDKGTPRLNRQQIQDRLDELKTELKIAPSIGAVTLSFASRRDTIAPAIALAGELLRESNFPAAVLEELRGQGLTAIEQQRHEPEAVTENAMARHGDPYPRGDVRHARSFDEQVADLKAVTPEQLGAFHKRFYGASNGEFAATGDFDPAALRQALEAAFGNWRSPVAFARVPDPAHAVPPTLLKLPTPDKQNALMLVQQAGVPLTDLDADYPALMTANYLLGGSGSSRLWTRIREKEGLSYGAGSFMKWGQFEPNTSWGAYAIFAPQNRPKVEKAFREEVARALKEGFSAAELAEAKRGLISKRRLARAQDEQLAAGLAGNLYLGRDFSVSQKVDDAIGALTLEQVNAALRKYVNPQNFVLAFGGDFKE